MANTVGKLFALGQTIGGDTNSFQVQQRGSYHGGLSTPQAAPPEQSQGGSSKASGAAGGIVGSMMGKKEQLPFDSNAALQQGAAATVGAMNPVGDTTALAQKTFPLQPATVANPKAATGLMSMFGFGG